MKYLEHLDILLKALEFCAGFLLELDWVEKHPKLKKILYRIFFGIRIIRRIYATLSVIDFLIKLLKYFPNFF